jgi:transcriptional regulator with XRE-family HTH domain
MRIQERFGVIIRRLRIEKGISQERLALDADIDRTYISDIEKGVRNVSIEMVERLAIFFQIPVSELFKKVEEYGK